MPDTTRTFLAVAVPEALSPRIERLRAKLAEHAPDGRWETPRPFHITLAFLGDVPHADLNTVCRATTEIAAGFGRFELSLTGPGAFPDATNPRVVWLGVGGPGLDVLMSLQSALAEAMSRLNYSPDNHGFRPHMTLGRLKPARWRQREHDLSAPFERFRGWNAGPFRVDAVVAFASTLGDHGPVYAPLVRAALAREQRG
jgi:2'-5' RNA ligase